ncbi:unnamed protein product [Diatraea saccharalis]|uniref:CRAL-TRIO domain-containing protein n=1 Tax=Diatraea saccharalis TaxID=40085 RepID=A0A9N9R8B5_9NEOP|nr:unnamed protein product [Diatraea saccharalis]
MECLPDNPLLKFHPDTLQYVRKTYNLDQPGAMDDAIDILESWVQKQQHFIKKEFDRDYLERTIIRAKGSVERAKERLDKICTSRTLIPHFFTKFDVKSSLLADSCDGFLPTLTKDHYRVYLTSNSIQEFNQETFLALYQCFVSMLEYVCRFDYSCGIILVLDLRNMNLFDCVKHINISDLSHTFSLLLSGYNFQSGYGFRLKGMHIITSSKFVDSLVAIFKQILNKKVGERIQVFRTVEEVYDHIEKDILPEEYGGKEMSKTELHQKWLDILSSEDHIEYMTNMNEAKTIEELRMKNGVKSEHLGVPGTFRALNMD